MSRKKRPVDDRENGALKAWELPDTPEDEGVSCPILEKVTLLPLRYGRVESLVPGVSTPYELNSGLLAFACSGMGISTCWTRMPAHFMNMNTRRALYPAIMAVVLNMIKTAHFMFAFQM